MPLYTFIMDYRGGTYISQVKSSFKNVTVKWAKNLDVSGIYGFGKTTKESLIEELRSDEPVPLDGVSNAWCTSALVRGELALIHFIETVDNEQPTTNN